MYNFMQRRKIELLIFLSFHFFLNTAFSQSDTSKYIISYDTEHLIDTDNNASIIKYPLYVFLGRFMSVSLSKNQYTSDSMGLIYKAMVQNNVDNITINSPAISKKRITSFESTAIYKDRHSFMYYESSVIGLNRFLILDSIKQIKWKINNKYKKILGYECQEAQCFFKCRNWTVWFSNEIPVSSGPWKLNGLPGLILEAKDDQKQISFVATEVINDKSKVIELPDNGFIKCNRKEFSKLLSAYAENQFEFIRNQTGLNILGSNTPPSNSPKFKVPNNPIEKCGN